MPFEYMYKLHFIFERFERVAYVHVGERGFRGGRGRGEGRGRGRGANGASASAPLNVDDETAFPSLA